METLKILVVDDEPRMRKLVKDFLTVKGFQVVEAGDGEEAIDIFFEQKDIALILLDVMMPKMDGWEVLKTIRKYSQVPILMLTARGEEQDELQGFKLGKRCGLPLRGSDPAVIGGATLQVVECERLEGGALRIVGSSGAKGGIDGCGIAVG